LVLFNNFSVVLKMFVLPFPSSFYLILLSFLRAILHRYERLLHQR
jgi:hypothetical protein